MQRRIAWRFTGLALITGILLLVSCSSASHSIGVGPVGFALSGTFVSETTVGSLGRLNLALTQRETSIVFDATLKSVGNAGLGESEGVGTVGNGHLILNFDRGLETDYYFEGDVEVVAERAVAIDGRLVFPDLADPLPVRFVR